MLDWDRITALKRDLGNREFSIVAKLFFVEVEASLKKLAESAPKEITQSDLHALKLSASNMGFRQLAMECQIAEHALDVGADDEFQIDSLRCTYRLSQVAFSEGLKTELTDTGIKSQTAPEPHHS